MNPDWYTLACDWLRGDDLDDEGLSILGTQRAIATEHAAQGILANLGRLAADTQPIVLCFDQLDNIARTSEGVIDLQAIFNVNSTIHNPRLRNFLVIISIITSTWLKELIHVVYKGEFRPRLLPSPTYASQFFSIEVSRVGRVGIAWNEDPNLTSFYHVMNACRRAVSLDLCQQLLFIRSEGIGKPGNQGYEFYQRIFTDTPHRHITPSLESVQFLATYHSLVNAAASGELVIAGTKPSIDDLESLLNESNVLRECDLLWDLDLLNGRRPKRQRVSKRDRPMHQPIEIRGAELSDVRTFLLDLLNAHQLLGRQVLVNAGVNQFPMPPATTIHQLVDQLQQQEQLQVLGALNNPDEQLVCLPLPHNETRSHLSTS